MNGNDTARPPEFPTDWHYQQGVPDDLQAEVAKIRYAEYLKKWDTDKVDERDQTDRTTDRRRAIEDADFAEETALYDAVHSAYLEVAGGSLDRSLSRAELLAKLTASVASVYAASLALAYGLGAENQPLPVRGFYSTIFLGIAIGLAAFYIAFLKRSVTVQKLLPSGLPAKSTAEERLTAFFEWTFSGVLSRAWSLRTGVVALGLGIATLPLAYLSISGAEATRAFRAGLGLLGLWLAGELVYWLKGPDKKD